MLLCWTLKNKNAHPWTVKYKGARGSLTDTGALGPLQMFRLYVSGREARYKLSKFSISILKHESSITKNLQIVHVPFCVSKRMNMNPQYGIPVLSPLRSIPAIARNTKRPEERRQGQGQRSCPKGCLDVAAASGNYTGAMDGGLLSTLDFLTRNEYK